MDVAPPPVQRPPAASCALVWLALLGCASAITLLEIRLATRHDGAAMSAVVLGVYGAGLASAALVGSALVWRRRHRAGWAFLALAVSLGVGPVLEFYARLGAVAEPGSLPGAAAVAHAYDPFFLGYFAAVTVALHLTPTGRPLSRHWATAMWASVALCAVGYAGGLLSAAPIDPPFAAVANPLAPGFADGLWRTLWVVGPNAAAAGLILAAAGLIVRFRRAKGAARAQLLWMSLVAAPLPLFVATVFAYRDDGDGPALLLATGGFIVLVPVAAALSITRFHLYEVDRIVSRTFTYLLLTALVAGLYAATVIIAAELLGRSRTSSVPVAAGTLAAAAAAGTLRRALQDALDRQFNRRRHEALAVVAAHLRRGGPDRSVEEVLRRAVADPGLAIGYWIEERAQWVTADGAPFPPGATDVLVDRDGRPVARLRPGVAADPTAAATIEAAARLAGTELDNARLRAALALQLVEVRASRARIATAQLDERRRIERNLHDGAQQRLLALAFDLRAAELNGGVERLREAVGHGIEQLHVARTELRDLANGLNPVVLTDGGLSAALDDLAERLPLVRVRCAEDRFPPDVEAAAWFAVCEAVANAVKHAGATAITVDVTADGRALVIEVGDDGHGGADPQGGGLQGLRDRIEAAGGTVTVADARRAIGTGTVLRARIPLDGAAHG